MQTFNSIVLLSVLVAATASAKPVRYESTGTFSPNPSISTIGTLTNGQPACVQFGSCSTVTSSVITETYGPGITSLSNKPTVVAPTDAAQSSSYQASLAAAGASSFFSSLTSSEQAASSTSAAAAATTSSPTGAAGPTLAAPGFTLGAGLLAFAAMLVLV